ncbi:MAG: pyrroline-5-carboxylate reductase family protein, partial [Armatimonadota bacterium]
METIGTVAFIGCGAMGSALARGAVAAGVCGASDVILCDAVLDAAQSLAQQIGARVESDCAGAARSASTVVLAVKPKDIPVVAEAIRSAIGPEHLVVSIAAGVSLARLENLLGQGIPVIRVMPNTPCQVGAGMSAYSLGTKVRPEHEETVRRLFGAVGLVEKVDEQLMDAVTALSGSGPAYFFLV